MAFKIFQLLNNAKVQSKTRTVVSNVHMVYFLMLGLKCYPIFFKSLVFRSFEIGVKLL